MQRRCWAAIALSILGLASSYGQEDERPKNQPHFTRINVGFARHVRNDKWAPVQVTIKNPEPETDVEISIRGEDEIEIYFTGGGIVSGGLLPGAAAPAARLRPPIRWSPATT